MLEYRHRTATGSSNTGGQVKRGRSTEGVGSCSREDGEWWMMERSGEKRRKVEEQVTRWRAASTNHVSRGDEVWRCKCG